MRIFGWNCRGICNAPTVRALKALIRELRSQVIFFCETKASLNRLLQVVGSLGFSKHITVCFQGRFGGFCLFWFDEFIVNVLEFNAVTIGIQVTNNICSWSLIGFYGPPYASKPSTLFFFF